MLVVGGKLRHSDVIKYVAVVLGGLLFVIATVVIVTCVAVKRHNLSPGQYLVYLGQWVSIFRSVGHFLSL